MATTASKFGRATSIGMNEWNRVRGRWTVKCQDEGCRRWGGFHEPERGADGYTFITHVAREGISWTAPCLAPVEAFAQMDEAGK